MDKEGLQDFLRGFFNDDTQSASRELLTPEGRRRLENLEDSPEGVKQELVPFSCGHFAPDNPGRVCPSCRAIVCPLPSCDKGTCANPLCGRPICLVCSRPFQGGHLCVWCLTECLSENELKQLEEFYRALFPWMTDGDTT